MPDLPVNSASTVTDLTGATLGGYSLIRRLGRGGMADVYLAEQCSLKRNVALKVLKPDLATDASYVKRFQREAQAAAALVQANIVQIYEVGCESGYYYIAQEYIRGRNLKQYLDRHGAVEPVLAINVLRQTALALQKASELEVVHRDIKPENIMLSTKGEVKVADFGLARANRLVSGDEKALTQIGVTMGTPLYMSPEQVGGEPLDHRSDIYSLGVTAYHMLAGEPPFDGETALAIAVQHVNKPVPALEETRPDIPLELANVVKKMMEKQPKDRQQSADQLLKEIREIKFDTEEDWEVIVEKLAVGNAGDSENVSTTLSQARLAATRQLQRVMSGHRVGWWSSPKFLIATVVLGVIGLGLGLVMAQLTKPEALLAVNGAQRDAIPKMETVVEQYRSAFFSENPEAAFQKVIDYFPLDGETGDKPHETLLFHRRARLRMGEYYLGELRFREAEEVFLQLSKTEDLNEDLQVAGFAGLAISYFSMPQEELRGRQKRQRTLVTEAIRAVDGREKLLNQFLLQRYQMVVNAIVNDDRPRPVIPSD